MTSNSGVNKELKGSTVGCEYFHSEDKEYRFDSASVEGRIENSVRYVTSKSKEGIKLCFEIPSHFKSGTHPWKANENGVIFTFDAERVLPGYGKWNGARGEFKILHDDFQNFEGEFLVYSKAFGDGSPPRLEQGHFRVKFENQGE